MVLSGELALAGNPLTFLPVNQSNMSRERDGQGSLSALAVQNRLKEARGAFEGLRMAINDRDPLFVVRRHGDFLASLHLVCIFSAYLCISLHISASLCISLHLSASLCIFLHLSASSCIILRIGDPCLSFSLFPFSPCFSHPFPNELFHAIERKGWHYSSGVVVIRICATRYPLLTTHDDPLLH